jgi:copper chaperone CopZ
MKRAAIRIEQVVFEHSRVGLAAQLSRVDGVTAVDVDATAHCARITYDDACLTVNDLRRLVDACGYGYGDCSLDERIP